MSASSLLSRVALNGSIDDHQSGSAAYHHLNRDFANMSMLNFGDRNHCMNSANAAGNFLHDTETNSLHPNSVLPENLYSNANNHHHHQYNSGNGSSAAPSSGTNSSSSGNHLIDPSFDDHFANGLARKSANMTETVAVPSSEHVAEIVGRQGCKIKSLRTQTNTYIKTPVRGAEPVFVVTGRREDVAKARQQILSAAEHFSSIRASRRSGIIGPQPSSSGTNSPTSVPGHITSQVRVPYKVVGLVVGPKGATIKRIQQTTSTYIVTPGRDKEPIFDVTGLPENVEKAKEEIEKHIASRTGTDNNSDLQIDDFQVNGVDSSYQDQAGDSSSASASTTSSYHYGNTIVNHHDNLPPLSSLSAPSGGTAAPLYQSSASHLLINPPSVNSASASMNISDFNALPQQFNHFNQVGGFKSSSNTDYDIDEGFGTSGSAASATSVYDPSVLWNDPAPYGVQRSNSVSISANRILPPGEDGPHLRTRRTNSDPLAAAFQKIDAAFSSASPTNSQGSTSPVTGRHIISPRDKCKVCQVKEAEAGFVTCGHTDFCLNCAQDICQREYARRKCPICKQVPNGALLKRPQN